MILLSFSTQVYCSSHVPKSGPGHFDQTSVGIRQALNAPKSNKPVNEQIRGGSRDIECKNLMYIYLLFKWFEETETKEATTTTKQTNKQAKFPMKMWKTHLFSQFITQLVKMMWKVGNSFNVKSPCANNEHQKLSRLICMYVCIL